MTITNLNSTNVNGILDLGTAGQGIGNGVNASAVDEVLLIRAPIETSNSTGTVTITNCAIKVADVDFWLSYGNNTETNSTITLRDCYAEWNITTGRKNIRVTSLIGTHLRCTNTGGPAFLYTQAGNKAVIDAQDGKITVIDGVFVHEIAGAPLTYRNAAYKNCGLNILNWEVGDLSIRNIAYGSGTRAGTNYTGADGATYNTYDAWLGSGNAANKFKFFDCTINLSKIAIQTNYTSEMCFKYFSRSEKYLSGAASLSGLQVQFVPTASSGASPQSSFFVTTNGGGLTSTAKIDLLVQNTVNSGTTRSTGIADMSTVQNYTLKNITWRRTVRGYGYQSLDDDVTPTGQVGGAGKEAQVYLLPRTVQPSVSQAAAAALTGITFVASGANGGTITVTEPRTTEQLWAAYNNWIVLQANRARNDTWMFDGATLDMGAWSLAGTGTITGNIATTGTITAPVNGSYQDSTGVRASITNLDPQGFGTTWAFGWITTTNYTGRNPVLPPASWTGWNQSSGTGNSTQVTLAPTTEYQLFLRIPGYYAPIGPIATIDTTTQTSVSLPVIVDTDITGTNLWPQTAAHMTQAAKFAYDYGDQVVEYNNVTGATEYISFLAAYRALELIAKDPAMAYQLVQPLYVNGTKDGFTLPRGNPLKARMSDASTGGGILQADISYADNQAKAFDRFLANPQNVGNYLLIPQATAAISANIVSDIRTGLALEATVATKASQTSVDAIPTNPLLTTDTRLNNLDAAISTRSTLTAPQVRTELATELGRIDVAVSTRLATSAYTAPTTAPTAADNAAAVRTNLATELARIDATVSSRLPTASYVAPTAAPTAAQNASAVRTELTTELGRIDVATSTRLATAGYTAPANADIAAIKAKTDTLVNGPTLANIEASTVLAKEASVNTRATQTSVDAIPTNPLLTNDARLNNLDAAVSTRLASSAYVAAPTLASIRADIERTGGMLDTVPTLPEMLASTLAKQADLAGLAQQNTLLETLDVTQDTYLNTV